MVGLKNEGMWDRFIGAIVGLSFILAAFFWLTGVERTVIYILGFIFILSSTTGFSLVYHILGFSTFKRGYEEENKKIYKTLLIILIAFLVIGIVVSNLYTKKIFLKDFKNFNDEYKRLLSSTSQEQRGESINNYNLLIEDFEYFSDKYSAYKPYAIRGDNEFEKDLGTIKISIDGVKEKIVHGNLSAAYFNLESIRPVTNDMLRRNGLDDEKVKIADFYVTIEIINDAVDEKDLQKVLNAYSIANEKLKDIEASVNTTDVQLMRANLESIRSLSKNGEIDKLPSRVAELKSNYLRIYMKSG